MRLPIGSGKVYPWSFRNGDMEYLKKNHEKIDLPHPMIISDSVKNEEYMAVTGISMAARFAIEGGVFPEHAADQRRFSQMAAGMSRREGDSWPGERGLPLFCRKCASVQIDTGGEPIYRGV